MSNMSYCRFVNTVEDLRDCYENMDVRDLSESEASARKRLIGICVDIAIDHGYEIEREVKP